VCYDTCNTLIRDNDLKEGHPVAGTSGSSSTSCLGEERLEHTKEKAVLPVSG